MDKVILVNEEDLQIGKMDKYKAHEHPAKLHRASSVWLVNHKRQVLLQKRSEQKIVGAGWWGNAVCGNVRPGESYEDCARRRLREEIGIGGGVKLESIYKFTYKAYCNEKYGEYEVDQVFLGRYDGEVVLNKSEVSEVAWVYLNDLIEQVNVEERTNSEVGEISNLVFATPQETLEMNLEELKKRTVPCEIKINGKTQLLAPWTWMMLGDSKLIKLLN